MEQGNKKRPAKTAEIIDPEKEIRKLAKKAGLTVYIQSDTTGWDEQLAELANKWHDEGKRIGIANTEAKYKKEMAYEKERRKSFEEVVLAIQDMFLHMHPAKQTTVLTIFAQKLKSDYIVARDSLNLRIQHAEEALQRMYQEKAGVPFEREILTDSFKPGGDFSMCQNLDGLEAALNNLVKR
jgi:uncharacterized membrane protein YgaE (UPF0421/DUF939 family)